MAQEKNYSIRANKEEQKSERLNKIWSQTFWQAIGHGRSEDEAEKIANDRIRQG